MQLALSIVLVITSLLMIALVLLALAWRASGDSDIAHYSV